MSSDPTVPKGRLFLVPVPLGAAELGNILPPAVVDQVRLLRHFVVENAKTARAHLSLFGMPAPIRELAIVQLDKHARDDSGERYLSPALSGHDVGLLSEAGCPAVADPGALVVRAAHALGVEVVPLVGPSSILLAVMASGMSGQSFAFHGYLPKDKSERIKRIRDLEAESRQHRRTQVFIETPFRNAALLADLAAACHPATRVGVACDLTLPTQFIRVARAPEWRNRPPSLEDRPAIFLLYAAAS